MNLWEILGALKPTPSPMTFLLDFGEVPKPTGKVTEAQSDRLEGQGNSPKANQ